MFMRLVSQYLEAYSELSQTFKDGVFYEDSQRPSGVNCFHKELHWVLNTPPLSEGVVFVRVLGSYFITFIQ